MVLLDNVATFEFLFFIPVYQPKVVWNDLRDISIRQAGKLIFKDKDFIEGPNYFINNTTTWWGYFERLFWIDQGQPSFFFLIGWEKIVLNCFEERTVDFI